MSSTSRIQDVPPTRFAEALEILNRAFAADLSVHVVGPGGVGKSALIEAFAKRRESLNRYGLNVATVARDVVTGDPWAAVETALPSDGADGGLVVFDKIDDPWDRPLGELLAEIMANRSFRGRTFGPGFLFVATSRDPAHGFLGDIVIRLQPEIDEWIRWGLESKEVRSDVLAAARWMPQAWSMDPRGWHMASKMLDVGLTDSQAGKAIAGIIDAPGADALLHGLRKIRESADAGKILNAEGAARRRLLPKEPPALYAVAYEITRSVVDQASFERAMSVAADLDTAGQAEAGVLIADLAIQAALQRQVSTAVVGRYAEHWRTFLTI